jgi:hypothetical protein
VDKGDTQTHRQHGDCISLLLFISNEENKLKIESMPLKRATVLFAFPIVPDLVPISVSLNNRRVWNVPAILQPGQGEINYQ